MLLQTGGLSETLRSVRDRFQAGGSASVILLLVAAFISIFWIAYLLTRRQQKAQATTLPADPARLFTDLMARLGMSPAQRHALERVAGVLGHPNPALILISAAEFDRGIECWNRSTQHSSPKPSDNPAMLADLRATLFPAT